MCFSIIPHIQGSSLSSYYFIFLLSFWLLNARSFLSYFSSDFLFLVVGNRQQFLPSVFRLVPVAFREAFGCSMGGSPFPKSSPLPHWPFSWLKTTPSFNAMLGGRVLVTGVSVLIKLEVSVPLILFPQALFPALSLFISSISNWLNISLTRFVFFTVV